MVILPSVILLPASARCPFTRRRAPICRKASTLQRILLKMRQGGCR